MILTLERTRFFTNHLLRKADEDNVCVQYLKSRGLDRALLENSGCGILTEADGANFIKFLTDQSLLTYAKKLGIVSPLGQPFTDAIYFPLYDTKGNVVNYSIRCLPTSKIVSNGGSHYWTTRRPLEDLFGTLYPVRVNEGFEDILFLCEGAIDTLTLIQNGFQALGLLGVNRWNTEFVKTLKKYKHIVLAFDNDLNEAGQKATLKLAKRLYLRDNLDVFILNLPENSDLNEYFSSHSRGEFKEYINKNTKRFSRTQDFVNFQKSLKQKELNQNEVSESLEKDLERAKEVDIVRVFRTFSDSKLQRATKGYMTTCPFHDEDVRSFYLYTDTNSFYCFGCGKAGDPVNLARYGHQMGFIQAINYLLKLRGEG